MATPRRTLIATLAAMTLLLFSADSQAFNIVTPGDPILAIDLDFTTGSDSPGAEGVVNILDGNVNTKYLNFGITNTGFIVTPAAASTAQSFTLTTANDFPGRDPASWILYGTNDAITSAEHSNGREEDWTEIAMGDLTLPEARLTLGDPVGFSNAASYSSYKMIFPTVKDEEQGCCMQIADVGFFSSMDGSGADILGPANPIVPIRDVDPTPSSNSPGAEGPGNAIDRDPGTKYLNFGEERSGFIVTPSTGATSVTSFRITTANDAAARDPASWELYGTNDEIVTENNGIGDAEDWTLIDSGMLELPADRLTPGAEVPVNNTAGEFTSYRMIFPTVRDAEGANSMQIAEIELNAPDLAVAVVNRQTGEVSIRGEEDVTIASYELSSLQTEGLDASAWTSIASTDGDPGDTWTENESSAMTLAESDTEGGDDDGLALTAGGTYDLGGVWRTLPTAYEDLRLTARTTDGALVGGAVMYTGAEIPIGDYSGNGSVGPEDWPTFVAGYGGDYPGMSVAEAYLNGDLDGDLDSDINDFNLLVQAAGGVAALFGGEAVPEPSSLAMLAGIGLLGAGLARARRRAVVVPVAVAACGLCVASAAQAQSFTNVGGAPTGISIPEGQMNETEESGPENLFDDDFLDDPGVINDELFLLDYNDPDLQGDFLQYAGLGAAPKTVFFDYGAPVTANWFGYSQRSGGDPTADRVGMFEFWFSNSDFGGETPTTTPDATVKLIPSDERLLDSAFRPYSLSGDHTGRYVALRLTISELSADQPVSNIGGHEFRLLSGPDDVVLEVDRSNGEMTLRNNLPGAVSIEMKSYTIESPSGALDPAAFDGLGGASAAFPLGDGSGNGWEVGGGSSVSRIAEGYFSDESTLAAGVSGLSLGVGYNELTRAEDLAFWWTNSEGDVYDARVEYVGEAPDILPGDYNDDGVVDAGDYPVWRDSLGQDITLPNDATPGTVDNFDYVRWQDNYGAALAAAATGDAQAAPEPSALLLACCLMACAGGRRCLGVGRA